MFSKINMRAPNTFSLLVTLVILGLVGVCRADGLSSHFYKKSCPSAEATVKNMTWSSVQTTPDLPAKLLRLFFHDCFVRGCDASVLLDPVSNSTKVEKEAIPNLSLGGFEVIDDIKAKLEQVCPGKVSCADIVALAARDAVSYQFQAPLWEVRTGRRDGNVSLASEALSNLPSPFANFSVLRQQFAGKGLGVSDLVALSGAHSIGRSHCGALTRRLYNFTGKGDADPSLDPAYAQSLKVLCPNPSNPATTVEMDPNSSLDFDTNYFVIVNQHKGLFTSDATLLTDSSAKDMVLKFQKPNTFFSRFADSIKKMGTIGVLTGSDGEIRSQCRAVNSAS